jgi:hypothetical protein
LLHRLHSNRSSGTGPRPQALWTETRHWQGIPSPLDSTYPLPSPLPTSSTPLLTYTSGSSSEPSPQLASPSTQWPHPTTNTVPFGRGTHYSPDTRSPYLALPPSPFHSLPLPDVAGHFNAPSHQVYDWSSAPATPETPASDSLSDSSSYWLNSPHSDTGVELGQSQHRILSSPGFHFPRPGRGHSRNASHPYLPPRSRSAQPGGVTRGAQESSGVISGLALERQYAPGALSEDTQLGAYSSTSSSSVSPSDALGPSLSRIELNSPGPSNPAVVRTGVIKNRVASEAHLRKTMGRRTKEATFRCDWENCGQTFTANHNLKSTWSFSYPGDFGLTSWN